MDNIKELKAKIAELERVNAILTRKLTSRREERRSLLEDISNSDKANELFGIDHKNGKLYKSNTSLYGNFQTFFANIFRALNPTVAPNKTTGAQYIRHIPVNSTNQLDYEVYKACLEACIDVIYDAKQELQYREPIAENISDIKEEENE